MSVKAVAVTAEVTGEFPVFSVAVMGVLGGSSSAIRDNIYVVISSLSIYSCMFGIPK